MGSRLEKNSNDVSKRIQSHAFINEEGEEYSASKFAGFGDYMRRKKIKLQNLDAEIRSQSTDKPKIFRGIVAHVNGYTQPSLSEMHMLIVTHGGGFLQYLDGKTACTHIVASQLTLKKKAEFAKYRIVKPAWIVDSVNAGRLLPWDNYRLVDEGVAQKVLGFENGNIISQTNNQTQSYRIQTDTRWDTAQINSPRYGPQDMLQQSSNLVVEHQPTDLEHLSKSATDPLSPPRELYEEDFSDVMGDEDASLIFPALEPTDMERHDLTIAESADPAPVSGMSPNNSIDNAVSSLKVPEEPGEVPQAPEKRQLTAEEHNAQLLQNPHLAKSSTANPDFLNQYYRESRLHHLSAWKADLKARLQARALEKSTSQKTKVKKPVGTRRYIMHVDFDSFFAAVSLRKNPQFINQPVAIAHGSGPGSEIASCNYPARAFGVKNGMWMKTALPLCADLKVLPYDFPAYEDASRHFYDSILAIDGIVQSISIDEALIDVSELCIAAGGKDGKDQSEGAVYREQERACQLAGSLRASVKEKTGCDVSVGIGNNILLAKVALRKAKPAGQHIVKPEEVLDFIGDLMVTDLPGVAYSLGNKFEEIGVKYVKDIRGLTKERLMNALGPKTGEKLWDYSRGIDRAEVGDQIVRKSVSAEVNWGIRFVTQQQADEFVQCLCDELQKRLLDNCVKGRQLTMKIMRKAADAGMDPPKNLGHGKCDTFNKSIVLGVSTNDKNILGKEAISILRSYGFSPGELRGLGVQMQKLEPIKPLPTAGNTAHDSSQRRLQFKKPGNATTPRPKSPPVSEPSTFSAMKSPGLSRADDTIEEIPTPEKPMSGSRLTAAKTFVASEAGRPLNIIGTQFMMPTQIDPTVLAELPSDIRARFAPKQKSILDQISRSDSVQVNNKSRSASPYLSESEFSLPSQSQLDPETLAALPEDVREEILSLYRGPDATAISRQNQQLLPHSPRKARSVVASKKGQLTPTKAQKHSSLSNITRNKSNGLSNPTLTQSNFVSMAVDQSKMVQKEDTADEGVSRSFLDELPEDIRHEILDEQKRNRLRLKSGLDVGSSKRRPKAFRTDEDLPKGQQKLQLSGLAPKPTFTSKRLSTLPQLRNAMSAWVQEFSDAGEEGPFEEDAHALGEYLQRVIIEESDMSKAAAVIEWLAYLVSDWPFKAFAVRDAWHRIILDLKNMVQIAVAQRGLPPLNFESP